MSGVIQQILKQQRGFQTLEEEVFLGLQIVADRLMEPWATHLRESADLTTVQYNVLRILRGAGPCGLLAGEVAERLITRNPDVTRLIDRLEKRGLVERFRDADDRRAVRIHITPDGLERIAPLDQHARSALVESLTPLGPERLSALRDSLESILTSVANPSARDQEQ
jgi:DNA-binding MarR family transcriptional regulator